MSIPREEKYVAVRAHIDEEGMIMPESIICDVEASGDPPKYRIDRVIDRRKGYSVEVGSAGMKYVIEIQGRRSNIFFEPDGYLLGKWFVEKKEMSTGLGL